ncbi:porin family protein [Vibrio sp. S9_S30]|uniref:outer membrane beta-barrel protein n=1 Tax=Vibrio sp. S9_S30 TaxID=2720226 RepID=UPI00168146CE|nr:outer membrane beta-barrel protein [Vibrio sp. S9_S30]MBD1557434.1 porin family protein [Vibrio sp. S9_S30]
MNKTILLSALSLAIALPAQAQEDTAPSSVKTEGFYVGLDLGISNQVNLGISNQVNDTALTTGYGLFAGYEFDLADNFTTAVEVDYFNWGEPQEFSYLLSSLTGINIDTTFSGYTISAKPRYYLTNNIFVGGSIGYSSNSFNADVSGYETLELANSSGLIFGAEAGYQHNNGFLARAGYKATSTDFSGSGLESIAVDLSSFYVGIGYKF